MSARDEARAGIRARQQRKAQQEAAARVSAEQHLATLGRELGALYREHPDRADGAPRWAEDMHEIVPPGLDALSIVRTVCEWFEAVQHLHDAQGEASGAVGRMDAHERQTSGQTKGVFLAAIREAEQLHGADLVSTAELDALQALITAIVDRLPSGPDAEPKEPRGITLERQFGETLMSLLMAAGFRPGAGQRFTIGKAASHAAKIARGYGFDLSENSLRTWASQLNKKKL